MCVAFILHGECLLVDWARGDEEKISPIRGNEDVQMDVYHL